MVVLSFHERVKPLRYDALSFLLLTVYAGVFHMTGRSAWAFRHRPPSANHFSRPRAHPAQPFLICEPSLLSSKVLKSSLHEQTTRHVTNFTGAIHFPAIPFGSSPWQRQENNSVAAGSFFLKSASQPVSGVTARQSSHGRKATLWRTRKSSRRRDQDRDRQYLRQRVMKPQFPRSISRFPPNPLV